MKSLIEDGLCTLDSAPPFAPTPLAPYKILAERTVNNKRGKKWKFEALMGSYVPEIFKLL